MTGHDALFSELNRLNERLSGIELTLSKTAVQQDERILSIKAQLDGVGRKYDEAFGPEGTIAKLQVKISGCPRDEIKTALSRQWAVITLIVALIGALKIWG
jgi:hypothetical protein